MARLGLRPRVLLIIALSTALVLATVTPVQMRLMTAALEKQYQARAEAVWRTLAASYADAPDARGPLVQEQLRRVVQANPDLHVVKLSVVVDGRLLVVASTQPDEAWLPATDDALRVMETGQPIVGREVQHGVEVLELDAPLLVNGETAGVVEVAYQLASLNVLARTQALALLGITGGGSLALLVALYWELDRTLLGGIARLHRRARAIAAGNLDSIPSEDKHGPGELGELETAFEQMRQTLQEQHAANLGLQAELRQRWAEAERRAVTDLSTRLYNHTFFRQRLEEEIDRARRTDKVLALLFCDLDHFKLVNDTYGHQFGDRLLQAFANILCECTRQIDISARYGGEEFSVILPATCCADAVHVAERIRARVASSFFDLTADATSGAAAPVPITVSIGIACYPDDATDRESLVQAADRAMYRAKQFGRNQVRLYNEIAREAVLLASNGSGDELSLHVVHSLAAAVDARDRYTGAHSQSVARYAALCAKAMGLPDHEVATIATAGMLHDVGKIGLPDSVLAKPGPLSDDEWFLMREHPAKGKAIVAHVESLRAVVPVVTHHHERFDGSGYPDGLAGEAIPFGARIVAVADTFHAMTSDRPYRRGRQIEAAMDEIARCAGSQFDPAVADAFRRAMSGNGVIPGRSHSLPVPVVL